MNLEAIRKILLMTPTDAAKLLAATEFSPKGVSETTWNRWEKGVRPLPSDVRKHIENVLAQRKNQLLPQLKALDSLQISWPEPANDLQTFIDRSVAAELLALQTKEAENG